MIIIYYNFLALSVLSVSTSVIYHVGIIESEAEAKYRARRLVCDKNVTLPSLSLEALRALRLHDSSSLEVHMDSDWHPVFLSAIHSSLL